MDPRKTDPNDIIREGTRTEKLADRDCRVLELAIDVSDRPEGEVFTVVTSAIYWNGFPDQPEQWTATGVVSPLTVRAELGIVLPDSRRVKSWSLWKYTDGKKRPLPDDEIDSGRPRREEPGPTGRSPVSILGSHMQSIGRGEIGAVRSIAG